MAGKRVLEEASAPLPVGLSATAVMVRRRRSLCLEPLPPRPSPRDWFRL